MFCNFSPPAEKNANSSAPHGQAFHNPILPPLKPHLLPLPIYMSHLHSDEGSSNISSLFFCDFEQAILLGDVVLFPPFCQVNCTSFKNQYKCHLLWGLLALLGRVSAFSACYLYPLCDLLFCTVIMSVPVFLPRLHAPKRRDCDALIFVCKAETGGQPIKCTINVYWVKKNPT